MATPSKAGRQSKSTDAGQEIPATAPDGNTVIDAPAGEVGRVETVAAEAAPPEPAAPAAPAPEIVDIVATPLAIIEEAVETATESFSASFEFDTSLWSKKSFELWSENASAFLDLAERLAKAQTFEEVVDLQSRFASDRFDAFVRQSKEFMDLVKNVAGLSAAPLCGARQAA